MDWSLLLSISIPVITGFLSILGFWVKSMMNRIEKLEERQKTKQDEQQVRQLMADKVDPLKEKLEEIKDSVDRLYDLWINNSRK
jgi:Tfp pilus assembly protein PilO